MIAWAMGMWSCCILWFSHKNWHNFDAVNMFGGMVIMDDDHSPVLYTPPSEKLNICPKCHSSIYFRCTPMQWFSVIIISIRIEKFSWKIASLLWLTAMSGPADPTPCTRTPHPPSQSFVVNLNYVDDHIFFWALPRSPHNGSQPKPSSQAIYHSTDLCHSVSQWMINISRCLLPPTELCELLLLWHYSLGLSKHVISGRWFKFNYNRAESSCWKSRSLLQFAKFSIIHSKLI